MRNTRKPFYINKTKIRPFGFPRCWDIVHPDLVDGRAYATKSSSMKLRGKGGNYRSTFKSKQVKRNARRVWKKMERHHARENCLNHKRNFEIQSRSGIIGISCIATYICNSEKGADDFNEFGEYKTKEFAAPTKIETIAKHAENLTKKDSSRDWILDEIYYHI